MKTFFLSALIIFGITGIEGQNLHFTIFGGISNYQGDLQSKRFTFQLANAAYGAGALYEITPKLYLRANVTVGKLKGDDKISRTDPVRNLSFSSPVTDVHLGLEYDLLNSYEKVLVPYVFAGVSAFHFNPSAVDTSGNKYSLQPLGTEGQGFFMGRKKYSLTALALPFGAGLKLSLSQNIKVRFEFGLRKTFTDYLDDVSSTYADQAELLLNNGSKSVDLAFRGDENKSGLTYPNVNSIRGNPKSKDWYYFTGIGISFRLMPKFDTGGGHGGGRKGTGCPVNIY